MSYPMPTAANVNWSNGFAAGFEYVNTITSGLFTKLMLVTLFIIVAAGIFAAKRDWLIAGTSAAFATWSIALMLWLANVSDFYNLMFLTAILIVCITILFLTKKDEGL